MNVVYVTGNEHKAAYFSKMVGIDVPRVSLNIDELQELDLEKIVRHKAMAAYELQGTPVLVEDTSLKFEAMGRLPGPYIKWFLDEMGVEDLCKLAHSFGPQNVAATAGAMIAYYDGTKIELFKSELKGTIAQQPLGDSGFGWNVIFIPNGQDLTLGQMDEATFEHYYKKIKPFTQVRNFLDSLQA